MYIPLSGIPIPSHSEVRSYLQERARRRRIEQRRCTPTQTPTSSAIQEFSKLRRVFPSFAALQTYLQDGLSRERQFALVKAAGASDGIDAIDAIDPSDGIVACPSYALHQDVQGFVQDRCESARRSG